MCDLGGNVDAEANPSRADSIISFLASPSNHSAGIPDSPQHAPANCPYTAPVVSASSPKLTALSGCTTRMFTAIALGESDTVGLGGEGVQPNRLHLDPATTGFGRGHFDRLSPVRAFKHRTFCKLHQHLPSVHRTSPHVPRLPTRMGRAGDTVTFEQLRAVAKDFKDIGGFTRLNELLVLINPDYS